MEDRTDEGGELEYLNLLACTLIWLAEEGYLRYASHVQPHHFTDVVLSSKGLVLLERPSSLNPTTKLIDSIKEEFASGVFDGVRKLGQQIIVAGVSKYLVNDDLGAGK